MECYLSMVLICISVLTNDIRYLSKFCSLVVFGVVCLFVSFWTLECSFL